MATAALRLLCLLALCAGAWAAAPQYRVAAQIALPGPVRWDYVFVDQRLHRLYVAHGTQTDLIDTAHGTVIGTIADTRGVHGIAVADELGLIFTSNGADNEIGVYDLNTRQAVRSIRAGVNPDAIVYEPSSQRVVAFNGRSQDVTVADARTGAVLGAPIPVGGKPEFAVVAGHGLVYFNIEDTGEIGAIDVREHRLVRRYSIAPCRNPTGLDLDPKGRLYSVCDNGLMVISDPASGRVIGQSSIGAGPDGVAWLDGYAFSANGRDGTVSVVGETGPGRFETLATVAVAPGARTIAADRGLHKLYLPTADLKAQAPVVPGEPTPRREAIDGTFKVFVLEAH